jgi:hypothetical protein
MDENSARSIYQQKINDLVESLLPNGAGTLTEHRLRFALDKIALLAFSSGESYALLSLLTIDDVAERLGVSRRRLQAIAREKHDRFGIGFQIPGSTQWLFRESEVESLRPGNPGRPRKTVDA